MKRVLVVLLGAVLLAAMLAVGTVVFLAATEGGTRFLAQQAERFLPIRFTAVSGALLREVRVGRLTYRFENHELVIDELAASVEMMPLLFENHLIVHSASAEAVILTRTGEPAEQGPAPALELPFVPLTIDAAKLRVERLQILELFPMRVAGSADWAREGLEVHSLSVHSDVIVGNVTGRLGNGSNPAIAARVNWSLPDRAWGGEGRLNGQVDDFELHHVLRGYVSVDAQGRGDLSNLAEPAVDVQVSVQDLAFGDTAIRDIAGRVSGTISNATADVSSEVSAAGLEPFQLDVVAYGPANGPLTLRNVSADALGGTQEAQGSVSWQDGVRVLLGGRARNVSVAALREELAGVVSAAFQFRYQDGLVGLGLHDISGTLNQRPVEGTVEVAQLENGWLLEPVRLNLGDNRLSGSARLEGAAVDIQAEVNAPALEALALDIAGDAVGSVRLSGEWPDLNGSVLLDSSRLAAFDAEIMEARIQASMNDGVLDGSVAAEQAKRQQLTLDQVRLGARGPLENLGWQLSWAEGEGTGTLERLEQGFALGVAAARMDLLDQQWSLRNATRVVLQDESVEVAPACITGGGASACVERFVFDDGRIETTGELERAPVALFRPWLPIRLGDAGYLEGQWSLGGSTDALSGDLAIAARQLSYVVDEEQAPLDLPDLEAEGTIADGGLRLRLAATDQAFSLEGNAQLQPVASQGTLSGAIRASATELSPLKVFDQRIEELGGDLQGQLALSGTLAEPRVEGRVMLTGGGLKLNDPDVDLADVDVRLRIDDTGTFEVEGGGRQDEDDVRITASGSGLFNQALAFEATLKGEHLRGRHPDWEITVSPDLTLEYAAGRGRIRGSVEVPEAEVRLATLPTSVPSPSDDVVVVGRQTDGNGDGGNWLRADVDVVLGEDVTLKALGITAQLEGSLRARLDAQGRTTLRGTLDITEGVLTTQGQTLTIESGTVAYNGPVTRPYIDVRAVRVIEDVTPEVKVGVHIRGDANNLTSSVFSEPAMAETRALSFLVLGRDMNEETASDDSSQLVAAAINLGLARSKGITSELMRMTGLDELSAMAESQNSFAIVAGKRVTDDLYVRYTYNTLSALGAFLVRYELSRKWQLEAHSGEQSAMDILYSVEK